MFNSVLVHVVRMELTANYVLSITLSSLNITLEILPLEVRPFINCTALPTIGPTLPIKYRKKTLEIGLSSFEVIKYEMYFPVLFTFQFSIDYLKIEV